MAVTLTYNRLKSTTTNSTGMVFTVTAEEKPETPTAFLGSGNTAEVDVRFSCDADESGGADVQEMFRLEAVPQLSADDGTITLKVTVTPKTGGGTDATATVTTITHTETMDAWQTAAGRARQA